MIAQFERFNIGLTKSEVSSVPRYGRADDAVEDLVKRSTVARQLRVIGPEMIRAELKEYGTWDADELRDDEANKRRIVWIAVGNIREEYPQINPRNPRRAPSARTLAAHARGVKARKNPARRKVKTGAFATPERIALQLLFQGQWLTVKYFPVSKAGNAAAKKLANEMHRKKGFPMRAITAAV